jgi:hypothetical protein
MPHFCVESRDLAMRCAVALASILASISIVACSFQAPETTSHVAGAPPIALPFKGRLVGGDPGDLPSAVALSLSSTSPVTIAYREELSHDEYHIPLIVSAFDPVTYVGAPLGEYGVTAFATLSIVEGGWVLGEYTAKAHVTKSYSLYSEPTHEELERAARAAVRERIDQKLYRDAAELAKAAAIHRPTGAAAGDK